MTSSAPAPAAEPTTPTGLLARISPATRRWLALGAWVVTTALVAVALHAIGWQRATHALRQASVPWLAVAVLANLAIIALWAWQMMLFLPATCHLAYRRMLALIALTTTATNTIPAFLGQATGVAIMAERGGIGAAVSVSALAQHQFVEGIAKVAMLLVAAHVAPLPSWMHNAIVGLTGGMIVFAIVLVVAARASRDAASNEGGRVRRFVRRLAESLVALRSPWRFALATGIAFAMKGAEAFGWFAVERALHVSPAPGSPFLALGAVNLASALSASPGNLGIYETAAYVAYTTLHVPHDTALALALAGHVCYLFPLAGTGYVILTTEGVRKILRRK